MGRRHTAGCLRPVWESAKIQPPAAQAGRLRLQGVKMGRPSHVHMSIGLENGEIASVRVGGESVLAGEGTLYL